MKVKHKTSVLMHEQIERWVLTSSSPTDALWDLPFPNPTRVTVERLIANKLISTWTEIVGLIAVSVIGGETISIWDFRRMATGHFYNKPTKAKTSYYTVLMHGSKIENKLWKSLAKSKVIETEWKLYYYFWTLLSSLNKWLECLNCNKFLGWNQPKIIRRKNLNQRYSTKCYAGPIFVTGARVPDVFWKIASRDNRKRTSWKQDK